MPMTIPEIVLHLILFALVWLALPPRPDLIDVLYRWRKRRRERRGDQDGPLLIPEELLADERPKPEPPSPPKPGTFTRWDGEKVAVDCLTCPTCKNYFWVQNLVFESPVFCCYCGTRYDGSQDVGNEESSSSQIL